MEKLFADEKEFLKSIEEMTPGQHGAALETYVNNCTEKLRYAQPAAIAEELRSPSTRIPSVTAAVLNETLARILTTCAL